MSVTIIDVAHAAGVSKTTASDALRGSGRVAPATQAAVEEAARRLGYRANRSARSLRGASTGAIGLYLPQVRVGSDYYLAFLYGVAEQAALSDHDVMLTLSGSRVGAGYEHAVDGVIVCDPRADDPLALQLLASDTTVVSCEPAPAGDIEPDGVVFSRPGRWLEALLGELVARGAQRPAMVATATQSNWAIGLRAAYGEWCARHGVDHVTTTAAFGSPPEVVHQRVGALLERHPAVDALVCVSDSVAASLAPALGTDLLLASCSEQQLPLGVDAAINTRAEAAGRECAALLVELLSGGAARGTTRELPLEILLR